MQRCLNLTKKCKFNKINKKKHKIYKKLTKAVNRPKFIQIMLSIFGVSMYIYPTSKRRTKLLKKYENNSIVKKMEKLLSSK